MSRLRSAMQLDDAPVALVTGAGGAIGRSIAARLSGMGYAVAVNDINRVGLDATVADFEPNHAGALIVEANVTDEDAVDVMIDKVARWHGRLDVLVTSAGVISVGRVQELTEAAWDHVLDVNLKGTFLCTKTALTHLLGSKSGRVICIASDAGKTGEPYLSHYCASKFGVIGFVQSLALEFAQTSVTVNAICPVICEGPMADSLARDLSANIGGEVTEWRDRFISEVPLGRMAVPEDVAAVVAFLVSAEASFMSGQALNVSGAHEVH